MLISLTLFGREIFSFEAGRRYRVVPDGSTLVTLGVETEITEDEDDDGEPLAFGFAPS